MWTDDITIEDLNYVFQCLSPRRKEILRLYLNGLSDDDIASNLVGHVVPGTVRRHRADIDKEIRKSLIDRGREIPETASSYQVMSLFQKLDPRGVDMSEVQNIHGIIEEASLNERQICDEIANAIQNGADINGKDVKDRTPLFLAVEKRLYSVVSLLLGYDDLDVNLKGNDYGWTPLHKAANLGSVDIVNLLLAHPKIDPLVETHKKATAIYEAAFGCNEVEIIRLLEERGCDIKKESEERFTPLMVSIWRQNYGIAEYLIEQVSKDSKEHINKRDIKGETALYKAITAGSFDMIKRLLDAGADYKIAPFLDSPDLVVSPLLRATGRDDVRAVQWILSNCSNDREMLKLINEKDPKYERSALSLAAEKGFREIVKLLIANGADVFSRNNHGRTPRDMTLRRYEDIYDMLLEEERKVSGP